MSKLNIQLNGGLLLKRNVFIVLRKTVFAKCFYIKTNYSLKKRKYIPTKFREKQQNKNCLVINIISPLDITLIEINGIPLTIYFIWVLLIRFK